MKKILVTMLALVMLLTAFPAAFVMAEKEAPKKITVNEKVYYLKAQKGTYYVTEDTGLNIRELPDKTTERIGGLSYGDKVEVNGFVYEKVKKGEKYKNRKKGWVEITFMAEEKDAKVEKIGYIRNELSLEEPPKKEEVKKEEKQEETEVREEETEAPEEEPSVQETEEEYAQCPNCGEWYQTGVSFRSHVTACGGYPNEYPVYATCDVCGGTFYSVEAYNEHFAYCYGNDYDACPYCGGLYHHSGGQYEVHVASCPYNQAPTAYTCPICGMLMNYGEQYTHVCYSY